MKASLRKIHFDSDGYREFALTDVLNEDGEPTGIKRIKMKIDGVGIVQGIECPIQIHFSMDELEGDLLFDDLLHLKREREAKRKARQDAEYKEKGVVRRT